MAQPALPWWRPTGRTFAHVLAMVPLAILLGRFLTDQLGANPIEAVIRDLGDWALRFLVMALAVTPLRKFSGWAVLARYRRMVGLWAFAYAVSHVLAYVVLDQFFDWEAILKDIVKHKFITVGMVALTLLIPLAVTSTNGMIRRLGGPRWRRLHQLIYVIGPLAAVHYIWMVKADIRNPLIYLSVIIVLLCIRGFFWAKGRDSKKYP